VRRAIVALVSTAAGTVLLVGAKAGLGHPAGPASLTGEHQPQASGRLPGSTSAPARVPTTNPAAAPTTDQPANPTTDQPTNPTVNPTTKPPANGTKRDGTWNGASTYTEFGNVELAIVVSGGKITDVKVLDYPQSHSRSVQINNKALPKLRQEALAAQSASINTVSGATYTSEGYRGSLQSAITKALGG
jgi:uncharacterized protein with FMN-binding domain